MLTCRDPGLPSKFVMIDMTLLEGTALTLNEHPVKGTNVTTLLVQVPESKRPQP